MYNFSKNVSNFFSISFYQFYGLFFKFLEKYSSKEFFLHNNVYSGITRASQDYRVHQSNPNTRQLPSACTQNISVHELQMNPSVYLYLIYPPVPLSREDRSRAQSSTKRPANQIYRSLPADVLRFYDSHVGHGET